MKFKRIFVLMMVLMIFVGCSASPDNEKKPEVIEFEVSSIVGNAEELVNYADKIMRFKVLDDLTEKNSTIKYFDDGSKAIEDFYSAREVTVLSSLSKDEVGTKMTIYVSEAIEGNKLYKYEGSKSLQKGEIYYGYLIYSEQLNGYIVIAYESALLNDDFDKNSAEDKVVEFYTLASLYPEVFSNSNVKESPDLKLVKGIMDFVSVEEKSYEIDGKKVVISVNYDKHSNTETVEYQGFQFQTKGRFASY